MAHQQRHDCMSHIRSKDTAPEVTLRRELFRLSFRFRMNVHSLPGTPDIVLPKYRTVIFVNGCFWHGHKDCRLYTVPKTNVKFWTDKIKHNQESDLLNIQRLETLEWNVITVWECQVHKSALQSTMQNLEVQIRENEAKWQAYKTSRRQDRLFALEQARKCREIEALIESELDEQFHIPSKIKKLSKQCQDKII